MTDRFPGTRRRPTLRTVVVAIACSAGLIACAESRTADSHFQAAQEYYAQGEMRAAIIELKNVLQKAPDNAAARLLLGQAYLNIDDGAGAEKELQRARELGLTDETTLIALGKAWLLQGKYAPVLAEIRPGEELPALRRAPRLILRAEAFTGARRYDEARAALNEALRLEPAAPEAWLAAARLAFAVEDYDEAAGHIDKIFVKREGNSQAWRLKGEIEFARQRYAAAYQAFQRAIDSDAKTSENHAFEARLGVVKTKLAQNDIAAARAGVEELLKIAPRHPVSNYLRGLIAYRSDQLDIARQYLETAVAAANHRPSQLLLGAVHYAQGQLEQAEMYLSKVVVSEPANIPARKLLASTRLKLHKPAEAMVALAGTADDDAQLLAMLGEAATQAGETKRALEYLQRAVATNPNDEALRTRLAQLYLARGDLDAALHAYAANTEPAKREPLAARLFASYRDSGRGGIDKMLRRWLAAHPDDTQSRLVLATWYQDQGDNDASAEHYRLVLKDAPNEPVALNNLAWIYAERGDENALPLAERAYALRPRDGGINDTLGWIYIQYGEIRRGLELLRRADRLLPGNPEIQYHIAVALARSGDAADARARLAALLDSGRAFQGASAARRLLQSLDTTAENL